MGWGWGRGVCSLALMFLHPTQPEWLQLEERISVGKLSHSWQCTFTDSADFPLQA